MDTEMDLEREEGKSEDKYGELNALLNEMTSGETDAKKKTPIKESISCKPFEDISTSSNEVETKASVEKDSVDNVVEELKSESESLAEDLKNLADKAERDDEDLKILNEPIEGELLEPKESPQVENSLIVEESCETLIDNVEDPQVVCDQVEDSKEPGQVDPPTSSDLTGESQEAHDKTSEQNLISVSNETVSALEKDQTSPQDDPASASKPEADEPKEDSIFSENLKANDSDSIIDLLKKLSPERLKEIKSKVFSSDARRDEQEEKIEVEEEKSPEPTNSGASENTQATGEDQAEGEAPKKETSAPPTLPADDTGNDSDVILIDSDDDEPPAQQSAAASHIPEPSADPEVLPIKRKSEEPQERPNKALKKSKECVNPDCPKTTETFMESSIFISNFYYADKKTIRTQFVCTSCFDKAILKYEVRLVH